MRGEGRLVAGNDGFTTPHLEGNNSHQAGFIANYNSSLGSVGSPSDGSARAKWNGSNGGSVGIGGRKASNS